MPTTSPSPLPHQKIERQHTEHFHSTSIEQHGVRELFVTISPNRGEHFSSMIERLQSVLKENEAVIVQQQIFGVTALREQHLQLMKLLFGAVNWPISWIEGPARDGSSIAGMHVHAVSGARVQTVGLEGGIIGCSYDDGLARHLLLGGMVPGDTFCSEASQVRQVYDELEMVLQEADMALGDVIRTWFFLDRILSWYGDFNKVRNFIYSRSKTQFFPASTGVGAPNEKGTALLVDAWAVQPLEGHMKISEVRSPLQCAAPKYGSGFSRAVEIKTPGLRRILISGTASIDEAGHSLHPGDLLKQIELTMQVVEKILHSRKQHFSDITRATAYFKNINDAPEFLKWCSANHLKLPAVLTQADICRDELLFEIEVDTVAAA